MNMWRDQAKCGGQAVPDPTLPDEPSNDKQRIARIYCQGCPVIAECAADALQHHTSGIIRGGMFVPTGGGWSIPARARIKLEAIAGKEKVNA